MSASSKNLHLFPESTDLTAIDPFFYETLAREDGYKNIAGVDEVGRGPLAGPVVAAAVIIPQGVEMKGIHDSKQMTAKARSKAFSIITRQALAVSIGVVSHKCIDEINILNASLEAMKQAVSTLSPMPEFLLVDGIHKVPINFPQRCLKKGDKISRSISAASIVAKVYRDRIMYAYHRLYPLYGFNKHKGYGTVRHRQVLGQFGPCPFHRRTFKGVR